MTSSILQEKWNHTGGRAVLGRSCQELVAPGPRCYLVRRAGGRDALVGTDEVVRIAPASPGLTRSDPQGRTGVQIPLNRLWGLLGLLAQRGGLG